MTFLHQRNPCYRPFRHKIITIWLYAFIRPETLVKSRAHAHQDKSKGRVGWGQIVEDW
jgi:hypothetical protein